MCPIPPEADASRARSWWPHVRAALLGLVVVFHGTLAAPLPHKVHPHELRDPVAREEVRRWTQRLATLGYVTDPTTLGERVVQVTGIISEAHRAPTRPLRPLLRWTGMGQGWALFANPDTHPSRLRIEGLGADGNRRVLFQNGDAEHAWLGAHLVHRRLRPIYDAASVRRRPNGAYKRLASWVWRRARVDHPELVGIEMVLLETHPTLPGSPPPARAERVRHRLKVPR